MSDADGTVVSAHSDPHPALGHTLRRIAFGWRSPI
jgi:hypothetical protein